MVIGNLDDGTADMADRVRMAFAGHVEHRGSVPEMGVLEHADLAERIERSIHRGRRQIWMGQAELIGEGNRGDVMLGRLEDCADDRTPGCCDASAVTA